jgi:hypothetical protein
MRKARRLAVVGTSAVLMAALVSGPAGAQTPPAEGQAENYAASAVAGGLNISIGGNAITLGLAEAAVESAPKAVARGVGQLNAVQAFGEQLAEASADGEVAEKPEACASPAVPEALPLTLGLACSSAKAGVVGGLPTAVSTGGVANVGLSANTVLAALPVTQPLQDGVSTIFDGLQPVFALDPNLEQVGTTVQDLLTDVITTDTLRIQAGGPSQASVTTDGDTVTATSGTSGVIVDLLPTGAVGDLPVARIEVGAATATVTHNRADGKGTPSFQAAVVKVTLAQEILDALPDDLVAALPFEGNVLSITVTDTTCLPLPEPLTSCITVGGGSVTENEDGSVSAMAAGVSLDLLKGLQGGVQVELAAARATGGGAPPVVAQQTLPRTGGSDRVTFAGVVLLGLAAGTWGLSRGWGRRRRTPESV